jgi:hypothetical protein
MDSEDNGIDALISDIEEGLQDDEDELQGLLGVQAISSEEFDASHQRTVSGAEEEKDSSSDNESSQEPNSFEEETADLDRENPYNAYDEEEEEQEDHNATMANQPVVIDVGGLKLTVRATPTTADATARALFPMEDRHSYPADKLASLFEAIGKAQKNKFGLLTLALEDQDKLEDTYALQMLLESTKEHFIQYGVSNVFTIILYDDADMQNVTGFKDILVNHSVVTMAQVAKSNAWYATMVDGPLGVACRQNLTLSATFLLNNMEEGLKHRCIELYMSYDSTEQGGPLLYKIMMDHLQFNTDAAGKALVTMLKKMKLNEIKGENVDKIVGLVRTTIQRLGKIQHSVTGASAIPDDLNESLIEVFKTSTVKKFNDIFYHLETQALTDKYAHSGMTHSFPSVNTLLDIAHNTYYDMSLANQWTGVTTKAKSTAFQASANASNAGPLTCWNCGGAHTLRDCKQKRDQKKIEAAKKKHREAAKENGQGGRGDQGRGRGDGRGGRGGRGGRRG